MTYSSPTIGIGRRDHQGFRVIPVDSRVAQLISDASDRINQVSRRYGTREVHVVHTRVWTKPDP